MDIITYEIEADNIEGDILIKPGAGTLLHTGQTYIPLNPKLPTYNDVINICSISSIFAAAIYFMPTVNIFSCIKWINSTGEKQLLIASQTLYTTSNNGIYARIDMFDHYMINSGSIKLRKPGNIIINLYSHIN